MDPEVYTFDLQRIFIGDSDPIIYLEILLRVFTLFVFTLVMIRIVGKRGTSQVNVIDVILIIALGSAVGDPMFYPNVPLLYGMLVITLVIILQRSTTYLTRTNKKVARIIESQPNLIIKNGEILEDKLSGQGLSKTDIYMQLRQEGIQYLDEVERAYFEPSGKMSVFKKEIFVKQKSILPEDIEN